jgi:hypothetical protein
MTVTTINFCRSFCSEANSGPSTDRNSAGVCNLASHLTKSVDRLEQNHYEGMISIVDNSELTKLMSRVVVHNSGSAKLLPMLVCGFHVVGAGTFRGLAHEHGRRPGTCTCYYWQVVLPDRHTLAVHLAWQLVRGTLVTSAYVHKKGRLLGGVIPSDACSGNQPRSQVRDGIGSQKVSVFCH